MPSHKQERKEEIPLFNLRINIGEWNKWPYKIARDLIVEGNKAEFISKNYIGKFHIDTNGRLNKGYKEYLFTYHFKINISEMESYELEKPKIQYDPLRKNYEFLKKKDDGIYLDFFNNPFRNFDRDFVLGIPTNKKISLLTDKIKRKVPFYILKNLYKNIEPEDIEKKIDLLEGQLLNHKIRRNSISGNQAKLKLLEYYYNKFLPYKQEFLPTVCFNK